MALFKNVDGTRIPLSPQEELEFNEREAEWVASADVRKAAEVRDERDALLVASDWTQVADAPVEQDSWSAYRQELRDVTNQEGFPHTHTFPEEP